MRIEMKECENFYHDKYGYCYYAIPSDECPMVYNLYVEPEYRRRGHARRILQFVISEIRKNGYEGVIKIEVKPHEISIDLKKLTSFYKSMGLEIWGNL